MDKGFLYQVEVKGFNQFILNFKPLNESDPFNDTISNKCYSTIEYFIYNSTNIIYNLINTKIIKIGPKFLNFRPFFDNIRVNL